MAFDSGNSINVTDGVTNTDFSTEKRSKASWEMVLELVTLQKNLERDGRAWMRFVYLLLNYHNNVYLFFAHYFNNQQITIIF